jgi:hypothetical protein
MIILCFPTNSKYYLYLQGLGDLLTGCKSLNGNLTLNGDETTLIPVI